MTATETDSVPKVVRVMAGAAGLVGANVHYSQPLVPMMAATFATAPELLSAVPAVTQVGFAVSILLVLPLADMIDRRWLIFGTISIAAIALAITAVAPSAIWVVLAAFFVGFGSVAPQALSPFAAAISPQNRVGQATGLVLSGILLGVLLSKVIAGVVAALADWRWLFGGASIAMVVVLVVLILVLPKPPTSKERMTFAQLVRSPFSLLAVYRRLRLHSLVGALVSFVFMLFWATYALHLYRDFGLGSLAAGIFGLAGIAGSLLAPLAGRLVDRGRAIVAALAAAAAIIAAFAVMWVGHHSIAALAIGALVLDAGVGIAHSTNQARVFGIDPMIRSRLNSVYMFSYFMGGSLGAVAGSAVYSVLGWPGLCAVGCVVALAIIAIVVVRREEITAPTAPAPLATRGDGVSARS